MFKRVKAMLYPSCPSQTVLIRMRSYVHMHAHAHPIACRKIGLTRTLGRGYLENAIKTARLGTS